MSYNGSGQFLINSTGQPVVANTVISATVFNALTADLATGLSTAITKDGQTTITANIPFGSNKITGLGSGTAATDAANLGQVQSTAAKLITVTGTDTITGSMSPALTAYAAGQLFYFVANAANTGPVTINIDSLGAKNITRDGSTALAAGDINSGEVVVVIYDGTRFQMINAANSFGNTTINGTLTVTGNTGLQANVSITSTLSVGGTFAVTGAATLGSTLAVTGKSDLPTVSTASINAAVALVTTGTVTNLTASSASIASANIGNLQFTAASIASINAGVAVITNLTATGASIASANVGTAVITAATVTGASIASANVGTAVITTGTVTNLTSTSASIASANAAVALVTTGTVTNLTGTSASIASANLGTAVITGLTVTGASIASVNVGAAVLSGNLTLSGGTANGVLYLNGSKVATSGSALTFDGSVLVSTSAIRANSYMEIRSDTANLYWENAANTRYYSTALSGTSTSPTLLTTYFDGTSVLNRLALDSSGNLGIGTTSPDASFKVTISGNSGAVAPGIYFDDQASSPKDYTLYINGSKNFVLRNQTDTADIWVATPSGNLGLGVTPNAWASNRKALQVDRSCFFAVPSDPSLNFLSANVFDDGSFKYIANGFASYYRQGSGTHQWYTAPSGTAGNAITATQAMTLDASNNLLLGTSTLGSYSGAAGSTAFTLAGTSNPTTAYPNIYLRNSDSSVIAWYVIDTNNGAFVGTQTNNYFGFHTNNTERARITAGGYFKASNGGTYFGSTGSYHELRQTANDVCVIASSSDANYSSTIYYADTTRAANAAFNLASWRANNVTQFEVSGNGVIYAQNTTVQSLSDGRLKENVSDATDGLNVINALRPVRYDWKAGYGNDRKNQLGFIAQEMETVFPDAVAEWKVRDDEEAYKTVGPGALIPVLVKAMQEQQAMINELKAEVAAMKGVA